MTNRTMVYYVLFIYIVTAHGWDQLNDFSKEYRKIFEADEEINFKPNSDRGNFPPPLFPTPQNVFGYGLPNNRGDLEYDLKLQQEYFQPILKQLQELQMLIQSLSMMRHQRPYAPYPWSYPKFESGMYSGDSSGPLSVAQRFPAEDDANPNGGFVNHRRIPVINRFPESEDTNQNWGIVTEDPAKNETNTKCDCDKPNVMAKMSNYMNFVDTPTRCKAATLSCCIKGLGKEQRKDCFASQRCLKSYETGYACLPVIIKAVYIELYG